VAVFSISKIVKNRVYNGYEVVDSYETSAESSTDYILFEDNVLKVTKEGASYVDVEGNTVWDCGYSMKMPEAVVNGDYAVVADINGRDVYVFDKTGKISSQTLDYDITNVDVASQGVYVLAVTTDSGHMINVYDKYSDSIYDNITYVENSGYPLDVALSDDGTKLFTSYINIADKTVENYLASYNLSSVGQNENSDRFVGGFTFEDTVFPVVQFIDNDTIVCFGDNKIEIYSMSEKPSLKSEITLDDTQMQGVFWSEDYIGYIEKSDDAEANYKIKVYDTDGDLKTTINHKGTYKTIYATEDEIIVVGDFDCSIYYFNGTEKFTASFTRSLLNFVPYGSSHEYIILFDDETQVIKLTRKKEEK
jgi:hypothetical protein